MTSQARIEFFLKFLNDRHQTLINGSNQLVEKLVGEDPGVKLEAAQSLRRASTDLVAALPSSDIPGWLSSLMSYLDAFIDRRWDTQRFANKFFSLRSQLENHRWVFDEDAAEAFDFDSIFEKHRKESRLPELFDKIVVILEEINDSGAVDSIAIIRALGKVIATIKKSRDGSYFSLNSAWEFLLAFLNNYVWGELEKIPMLGTAFEALRKTIDEADSEMFQVHSAVKKDMEDIVEAEVRCVKKRSEFNFISYDKAGRIFGRTDVPRLECSA